MKDLIKYGEFVKINSKVISKVDVEYSLMYLLFKIFKNVYYQSYRLFSSPKSNILIGQKWLFSFLFSIITIFLNPIFSQTETKIPLVTASGGIGNVNEGLGTVEMTFGQVVYQNEGNKDFITNQGIQQPFVNDLNSKVDLLSCDDILLDNKIIYSDETYQGVIILPYKSGNGASYLGFNLASEQVGGLTMKLLPGKLNKGNGSLELEIKGIPDKVGEAIFPLKFGTKECKILLPVKSLPPLVSSLDCDNIVLNPKVIGSKIDYSGELRINYSGGNNRKNNAINLYSTGISGLTLTSDSLFLSSSGGIITLNLMGKTDSAGYANFDLTIGGKVCKIQTKIIDSEIFIPTVFTPNGDGKNDLWSIPALSLRPEAKVFIFDRFGRLLIEYPGTYSGWNGLIGIYPATAGDYWYVIQLKDNQVLKGNFSLIR
jgi:gliding motility-associated-like protein